MQGCVYRCDIAGKSYIGKTSGKLEYRVSVHLYDANVKKAKNHFAQALCGIDETEVRNSFCAIETIKCIETGEEYESITEAAKIICPDVSPASLGSAIRRGHRYRGKHYAYIDR